MNHCTYWCRATAFLLLSTSSAFSIIAVSRRSSLSVEPQIVTVLFATSSQQQLNELPNLSSLSASLVESSSSSDVEKIITSSLSSSAESPTTNKIPPKTKTVPCPDCDMCDGSGRILGGIGTVLEWWPIKAYRPCPNFVERGEQYYLMRLRSDVTQLSKSEEVC